MPSPRPRSASVATGIPIDDVNRLRHTLLRLVRNIRSHSLGDVTQSQAAMLASVWRHGPATIGQLADHEHVLPPAASKIIAALERRGFVERASDPTDRRTVTVSLSEAGREYLGEVRAAATSWLAGKVDALSHDEAELLVAALPVLERLLEEPDA